MLLARLVCRTDAKCGILFWEENRFPRHSSKNCYAIVLKLTRTFPNARARAHTYTRTIESISVDTPKARATFISHVLSWHQNMLACRWQPGPAAVYPKNTLYSFAYANTLSSINDILLTNVALTTLPANVLSRRRW